MLDFTRLKHYLFIDIETVSQKSDYSELSSELQSLWDKKARFLRNEEELTSDALFFDRAAIYAEFGKIITIALGFFHTTEDSELGFRVKALSNHDERQLLSDFRNLMNSEKFDQDQLTLVAHNGKEFDFPYLSRRLLVNGLPLPKVLDTSGAKPWEVNHIDTMELWKFGDRKSFTSLELLTTIFEIPSSKEDIDGSMVNKVYYQEDGLERIARYCCNDVIATAQLYLKLNCTDIVKPENIIRVGA